MGAIDPVLHEQWFGPHSCEALADLAAKTNHLEGDVVELGCWEGRSTLALARAVKPTLVEAVDTWAGSPGEVSGTLAAIRDVYATFTFNTAGLNVRPHRCDWRTYFRLNRRPIRFIHVDAEHTYEAVRDTLAATLPLLVPGGIICGDDAHHEPIRRAVLERFPEAGLVATLWWVQL